VIDLKASHLFEPGQAHCVFEFRFSVAVLPTRFCNPTVCSGRALNALFKIEFKIENKQTALDRLRETVRAPEMRKRTPGFEYAPVATPGDQ